jgi:hypothetical protein
MTDIRDARKTGKELNFSGFKLKIWGLPLDFISDLAEANPKFAELIDTGDIQKPATLFAIAKDARKIISEGCKKSGDADFREKINLELVAEEQIEAIAEILLLSFPKLGAPLGEFLTKLQTPSSNP